MHCRAVSDEPSFSIPLAAFIAMCEERKYRPYVTVCRLVGSYPRPTSGQDPSSRTTQAEIRPKRCPAAAKAPFGESLSNDLDALDRAARSAHVATSPSSVGASAIPSPAHTAIDGTQSRSQTRTRAMEPSGPACTAGVASSSSCQRATESTDDVVSVLTGIHREAGSPGQPASRSTSLSTATHDAPGSRACHRVSH